MPTTGPAIWRRMWTLNDVPDLAALIARSRPSEDDIRRILRDLFNDGALTGMQLQRDNGDEWRDMI